MRFYVMNAIEKANLEWDLSECTHCSAPLSVKQIRGLYWQGYPLVIIITNYFQVIPQDRLPSHCINKRNFHAGKFYVWSEEGHPPPREKGPSRRARHPIIKIIDIFSVPAYNNITRQATACVCSSDEA